MTDEIIRLTPDELREKMTALGMENPKDFARAVGVSWRAVYFWLEGKNRIPGTVTTICRLMGV